MPSRHPAVRFGLVMIGLGAAGLLAWRAGWFEYGFVAAKAVAIRTESNVPFAAAAFVLAWAVLTTTGFPAVPLMVAGGAIFGTAAGVLLSLVGQALGAAGGYIGARYLAPPRVRQWMHAHLPVRTLAARSGIAPLVAMRLVPVLPFSAINYASGIAQVPWLPFLGGMLIGQLPSTVLYTYFADRLLGAARTGEDVARYVAALSGTLLVLSLLPWIVHRLHGGRDHA